MGKLDKDEDLIDPQLKDELKEDRSIEPYQLDVEAVRQADLFFKWSERAIETRWELEKVELLIKSTEAELMLECRAKPGEFGLDSSKQPTEAAIKAAVTKSVKLVRLNKKALRLRAQMQWLESAQRTLDMRKRMLESLITLHGQQYFAGPSTPRDLVTAWKEHQEGVEQGANRKSAARARRRKK